jgi:hypothetical protein
MIVGKATLSMPLSMVDRKTPVITIARMSQHSCFFRMLFKVSDVLKKDKTKKPGGDILHRACTT